MTVVTVPQLTDGTTHTAADHNNAVNTIANDYNGNIDNSNIKAGAAIDFSKVSGGSATALGAWLTYSTSWTGGSPVIGNGTLTSSYIQIGKTVFVRIGMVAGSSTTFGAGNWSFSLPVTANSAQTTGAFAILPIGNCVAQSGAASATGPVNLTSTTTVQAWTVQTLAGANPVNTTAAVVGSGGPVTWAAGCHLVMSFCYEAA